MKNLREMLLDEDYDKIWKAYCGFLDLTLDEFMQIQKRLLLEQIDLLLKEKNEFIIQIDKCVNFKFHFFETGRDKKSRL